MKSNDKIKSYISLAVVAIFVTGLIFLGRGHTLISPTSAATLVPGSPGSSVTNPIILNSLTPSLTINPKSGAALQYKITQVSPLTPAFTYTSPSPYILVTNIKGVYSPVTTIVPAAAGLKENIVYELRAQSCLSTTVCAYNATPRLSTGSGFSEPLNYFKIVLPSISSSLYANDSSGGVWNFNATLNKWILVAIVSTIPNPTITSILPVSALVGDGNTTVTLNGTNFNSGTTVMFNGIKLTTTYISPTKVTAVIPVTSLKTDGIFPLSVGQVAVNFPVKTCKSKLLGICLKSVQVNTKTN